MLAFQIPGITAGAVPPRFDQFLKIAVPVLSALVPAALTTAFKWAQDHDRQRRKADLIERIAKLAKNISELPELPSPSGDATDRVRSALHVELESALRELTLLQTHVSRRVIGVSSITSRLRSALLLYWPKGLIAWMLHIAFFVWLFFLALMTLGFFTGKDDPELSNTSPIMLICIYAVLGVPPLIIRYYAARIHRRQCARSEPVAVPVVQV